MILMTYSISKVVIGIMLTSITLLILYIAYKKLLTRLNKGNPIKEDYCVLYSLEEPIARGEVELYFTTIKPRKVSIELYNDDLSFNSTIKEGEFGEGGHIIRLDTTKLSNGVYFFALKSENQKTMKKMLVENA